MSSDTYKQIILTQLNTLSEAYWLSQEAAVFPRNKVIRSCLFKCRAARKSTKDVLVVTISLSIFSRIVAESVGKTRAPNIYDAHWRARIGSLLPDGSDKWWDVQSSDEAHLCGTEITRILTNRELPQMRGLASTDRLKSLWEEGTSPGLTDLPTPAIPTSSGGNDLRRISHSRSSVTYGPALSFPSPGS